MGYESAIVLFIVFLFPAVIYLVTSLSRLGQHEQEEQAEMDVVFSHHKND